MDVSEQLDELKTHLGLNTIQGMWLETKVLDLLAQEKAKHAEFVIGPIVEPTMNGKVIKRGETVTIDMENNLRDSCNFIQANGQYLLQQEQLKRAGLEK